MSASRRRQKAADRSTNAHRLGICTGCPACALKPIAEAAGFQLDPWQHRFLDSLAEVTDEDRRRAIVAPRSYRGRAG